MDEQWFVETQLRGAAGACRVQLSIAGVGGPCTFCALFFHCVAWKVSADSCHQDGAGPLPPFSSPSTNTLLSAPCWPPMQRMHTECATLRAAARRVWRQTLGGCGRSSSSSSQAAVAEQQWVAPSLAKQLADQAVLLARLAELYTCAQRQSCFVCGCFAVCHNLIPTLGCCVVSLCESSRPSWTVVGAWQQ